MGNLTKNIAEAQKLLIEEYVMPKNENFPVNAKLEYHPADNSWWFAFFQEGQTLPMGSGDIYRMPEDLRHKMKLDDMRTPNHPLSTPNQ